MTCECLKIRYTLKWPLTGENDRKKHWDFGMSNFHTNPNMRLLNNAEYIYTYIIYLYIYIYIYPILSLFMDDFPIISPIFRHYDSRPTFLSRSAKPKQSRCPRTPRLRAVPMAKYSAGRWIKSMDYAWKGLPWIPLQWNKPASSALIALIVIYSNI